MAQDFKKSNRNNVRQLPNGNGASHQNQILSALDTLGAKLVRSETERDTMRSLLNEALDAQDRLETQLERSSIDISRRIDLMEREDNGLSDEDRQKFEDQFKIVNDNQDILEDNQKRQRRVEDKLRDSQQTIAKLQRRLDSQEQKRVKLQRRIERVENIADDAQKALEAKAMVLLTDQSEKIAHLNNMDATAPLQILDDLHQDNDEQQTKLSMSQKLKSSTSSSWMAILLALGLGWGMATTLQPSEKAFVVMDNGQLAQVDLSKGEAKAIAFDAQPLTFKTQNTLNNDTTIEDDLSQLSTDWITEDLLDETLDVTNHVSSFDVLETVSTPEITMDKDLSLPGDIKKLEKKAFADVPEAQHDLAALYTAGQAGVLQNYERAAFWFRQAAIQGIGNAAYNLGVLYQQGLGQTQDVQRALDWYRRAAQLGHPEAQYNLGIAYIEGIGTRYNPNMAAAFFQQAAFSGIVEAAYNLGLILENGLLGEVRPDDALRWYRAAADNGSVDAEEALKTLAAAMNIPSSQAGLLENGDSLSQYTTPESNSEADLFVDAGGDISLGTLVPNAKQILIAQIQEQLRKARLYNGPQDGIVGSGTIKAVKSYQRLNNLPTDGQASEELLTYMLQQGTD